MADRKLFPNSIVALPDEPTITDHGLMVNLVSPSDPAPPPMTILFSLEMGKDSAADLEAAVAAGKTVPRKSLNDDYSADQASADKLVAWLKSQGYQIVKQTPDRTGVYASASVNVIEQSLQTKMIPVIRDGITYVSAKTAPSLPADVGANVHAIVGLQPFRRAHKHFRRRFQIAGNRTALAGAQPSPNIANRPPYLPSEIAQAYGAANLTVTGNNQVIAILIDTFPNDSDLTSFWSAAGVSVSLSQIQKVNVQNGALPPPEGEETLDVSWASGIAPGAIIRIYATGSLSFTALDMALDQIITDLPNIPGLNQLSISLGLGELYMGGADGEVAVQHNKLLKLAAAGVNVFVSTGDAGSNPDQTGHSPTGPLQPEYESTDTAVIAVGGTTLVLNADGSIGSEVAWASGGGGRSTLFPRQAWQVGQGVPAGTDRLVPDVCSAADPNTGAYLVLQGSPTQIGGTSWSAPTWAGFCALINEARVTAGAPPLPYLNALLYPLLGSPCFQDITSGSNGAYSAGPGYDLVTGLGSPNIGALIQQLVQPQAPPAAAVAKAREKVVSG
jgi:kumamolisin